MRQSGREVVMRDAERQLIKKQLTKKQLTKKEYQRQRHVGNGYRNQSKIRDFLGHIDQLLGIDLFGAI